MSTTDPDSTGDVSGTRTDQDIGERWLTTEHVTDILGDLTTERHVEEGKGTLGGSESGADTTEEETSGLITSLLFLETLANLPQLLPDESETSTKQPTDGTRQTSGGTNRSWEENTYYNRCVTSGRLLLNS